MIGVLYSKEDIASLNIAEFLIRKHGFRKEEGRYVKGNVAVCEVTGRLVEATSADPLGFELIYFVSRHRSAAGVASFTTHATGNWGAEAELGGLPRRLSVAAPLAMMMVLKNMNKIEEEIEKTYEATHHGPLLETPSLFVELGGNDKVIGDVGLADLLGDAIYKSISEFQDGRCKKVVVGIGGGHYPERFSRLAIEDDYAFAHIMPRYAINGPNSCEMLEEALSRSNLPVDGFVIEKKGLNTQQRKMVMDKIERLGIGYEMV